MLGTISQQAKTISGHAVVFLFKVRKELIPKSDTESILGGLKTIAEEIRPKTLAYDLIRIFTERKEVILVSALPEESARPTFSDLVETVQKTEIGEFLASFYVCPDALPDGRTLLQILENQLELIT
jgi:hypothetical protein